MGPGPFAEARGSTWCQELTTLAPSGALQQVSHTSLHKCGAPKASAHTPQRSHTNVTVTTFVHRTQMDGHSSSDAQRPPVPNQVTTGYRHPISLTQYCLGVCVYVCVCECACAFAPYHLYPERLLLCTELRDHEVSGTLWRPTDEQMAGRSLHSRL